MRINHSPVIQLNQHKHRSGFTLTTLFEVVCVTGFAIQLTLILVNYFSYPITTRVQIALPVETPVPDVVICFGIAYIANWTHILHLYPQYKSDLGIPSSSLKTETEIRKHLFTGRSESDILLFLYRHLTVRQITNVLYPSADLFSSIELINLDPKKTQNICSVHNIYRNNRFCYVFSCSTNESFTKSEVAKTSETDILRLNLNHAIVKLNPHFFLTLVPSNYEPKGNFLKWETSIVFEEAHELQTSFYIFEQTSLASPYPSDCFDYSVYGYATATQMRDDCFNNASLRQFGVTFHGSTIPVDLDAKFGKILYMDNASNLTFRQQFQTIVNKCFTLTSKPDCLIQTYFIKPRNPIPIEDNTTVITVGQIKLPTIKVIIKPMVELLDMIYAVGSISGTWFGFCIAEHVPKIYQSLWTKVSKLIANPKFKRQKIIINDSQRIKKLKI